MSDLLRRSDRRQFLKYLGAGVSGFVASGGTAAFGPIAEAQGLMPFQRATAAASDSAFITVDPIRPTDADDLVLPRGYRAELVLAFGDRFTRSSERFGFNADSTAFLPRNDAGTEGLLFVNHEFIGTADNYDGQAFAQVAGGVPTVDDMKFDVGRVLATAGRGQIAASHHRARTKSASRVRSRKRASTSVSSTALHNWLSMANSRAA